MHECCLVAQSIYLFSGKCHCCESGEGAKYISIVHHVMASDTEKVRNSKIEWWKGRLCMTKWFKWILMGCNQVNYLCLPHISEFRGSEGQLRGPVALFTFVSQKLLSSLLSECYWNEHFIHSGLLINISWISCEWTTNWRKTYICSFILYFFCKTLKELIL